MREKMRRAKNGIEIYSLTNPDTHSFFISLYLRSGSMYESESENGITHFLEHAAIRNVNYTMNGGMYGILDKHGIEFNASTYSEMVQFYVSGAAKNFAVGADLIARILSPLSLTPSELNAERGRIRAEIREGNDRTSLTAFTSQSVWGETSLSRPITGTGSTVSHISVKRLEEYRRRVFCPENLFFYVTGCVTEEELDRFADLVGSYTVSEGEIHGNVAPVSSSFGNRDGEVHLKNADFTKVKFTFDLDMSRVSLAECDLIYDILLGGYNSEFFIELSEKRGLFYDLSGSIERYKNVGEFGFSYELKAEKLYDAVEMTVALLKKLKEEPLPKEKCMYASYVDNACLLLDDPRELNFTFAYDNYLMGAGYSSIEERAAAYSSVTPERLCEVARLIFRPENLTFTMKGSRQRTDTERLKSIISDL